MSLWVTSIIDHKIVKQLTMNLMKSGLSTVTGVCTTDYNCVIGEFGITNQQGQPYPSTGFTSLYVMAHEIGHK